MIKEFFLKYNPDYRYRYEIYNETLLNYLERSEVWLDIGCGRNEHVAKFGGKVKKAIGVDITDHPDRMPAPFIKADIRSLPFQSDSVDLITLRMVVEHLGKIPGDLLEINRVLKPGGCLIVMTTNAHSPIIFLPRLLPYRIKEWLIEKTLDTVKDDTFRTYHKYNTVRKFRQGFVDMQLVTIKFIEQVPLEIPWLMPLFGSWFLFTNYRTTQTLRSNILAVFQKHLLLEHQVEQSLQK